jgi:hypothetical protein
VNVTELPGQNGFAEADIIMLTGRFELTDTRCWMLNAGLSDVQVSDEVRMQDTKSPFTGIYEKFGLSVPVFIPFTFHWKKGVVPPFIGVAVKVTLDPAQTGLAFAAIVTLTGRFGLTSMVIPLEVAGLFDMHTVSEDVSIHVITSPFSGVLVKVAEFVPELVPFTFHW